MTNQKKTTQAPPPINPVKGRGLYNSITPKPDYKHWKKMPFWSLWEASCLLCGYEPHLKVPPGMGDGYKKIKNYIGEEVYKLYSLIDALCTANQFNSFSAAPNDGLHYIAPQDVVKWAIQNDIDVSTELKFLADDETTLKNENPSIGPEATDMSAMGKAGAVKRWAGYNALMDNALDVADNKWASGDESWHNEMADFILGRSEFKELQGKKPALLKALRPVADKYGRKKGVKGVKKEKI